MSASVHVPVLKDEVLEGLRASQGGRFLDCTLGGAGHTRAILAANSKNSIYAIDRDLSAVQRAEEELEAEIKSGRLVVKHASFSQLNNLTDIGDFDGILADLGISSDQLADGRGFSFNDQGELDMRMDKTSALSAHQVVNETTESELYAILKRGGVANEARSVVREIVKARPIKTTAELASAVRKAAAGKTNKGFDPATVTFQAIRIAVNREFDEIESLMQSAIGLMRSSARLVVISFHSLEDKLVVKEMRKWTGADSAPANWPGSKKAVALGTLLTKKACLPSEAELVRNSRARSARMRVFEKF